MNWVEFSSTHRQELGWAILVLAFAWFAFRQLRNRPGKQQGNSPQESPELPAALSDDAEATDHACAAERERIRRLSFVPRSSQDGETDDTLMTCALLFEKGSTELWARTDVNRLAVYIRPRSRTDLLDPAAYSRLFERIHKFAKKVPEIVKGKDVPGHDLQVAVALSGASDLVVVVAWESYSPDIENDCDGIPKRLYEEYARSTHFVAARASAGWDFRAASDSTSLRHLVGQAEIACRHEYGAIPFTRERIRKQPLEPNVLAALRADMIKDEWRNCEVRYQPKYECRPGTVHPWRLTGVEALVRWGLSDGTKCSPVQFLAYLRDCGRMGKFNTWLIEKAVRAALAIQNACNEVGEGDSDIPVSINIVPMDFTEQICEDLTKECDDVGVVCRLLEIELVESGELRSDAKEVVTQLRSMGFGFSLDDFGTDRSNLDRIDALAVAGTSVKLDRKIINKVLLERADRSTLHERQLEALVSAWTAHGLHVIAEGVEEKSWTDPPRPQAAATNGPDMHVEAVTVLGGAKALERLQSLGINKVQGYIFSENLPLDNLIAGIKDKSLLFRACPVAANPVGQAARP